MTVAYKDSNKHLVSAIGPPSIASYKLAYFSIEDMPIVGSQALEILRGLLMLLVVKECFRNRLVDKASWQLIEYTVDWHGLLECTCFVVDVKQ